MNGGDLSFIMPFAEFSQREVLLEQISVEAAGFFGDKKSVVRRELRLIILVAFDFGGSD